MRTRVFLVVLGIAILCFLAQVSATVVTLVPTFEITGSGSMFHFESVIPGVKPFVSKIGPAEIGACITGTGNGCIGSHLEIDAGGTAYLFLVSNHHAFLATNTNCLNATEMQGNVGGDGSFMFAGHHTLSDTDVIVQGKVTFDKTQFPSLVPLSIKKASFMAVSNSLLHYAIGTFATVVEVPNTGNCGP
jgi:hypothetical protein